jgi:hypothetical protein
MITKFMLWVRARPDYEPLFSNLDGLRRDSKRRYWIDRKVMEMDNSDIQIDSGQISTGVENLLPMSNKTLTSIEEDIQ